jgi:hypothetical protein
MLRLLKFCVIVVGALTAAVSQISATQIVSNSSVVEGVVANAGTSEPIDGVTVELSAASANPASGDIRLVATNERGEFRFTDVKTGDYRLVATHSNGKYAPAEYLQRNPRGTGLALSIAQGQRATGLRLEMTPTSSISGRILDSAGFPVGDARVFALETVFKHGNKILNIVETVQTNDLGEFRLFWLLPGEYYLAAKRESPHRRTVPLTINPPGYGATSEEAVSPAIVRRQLESGEVSEEIDPITYFSGTTDFQKAAKITLPAGGSLTADILLASRVVTHRIRGRVLDDAGQRLAGTTVRAIPLKNGPQVVIPYGTTNSAGVFEIAGAVPGEYSVFAVANSTFNPLARGAVTGWTSVEVGSTDIENVTVTMRPVLSITGRIQVEGGAVSQIATLRRIAIELHRNPDIFGMPAGPGPANPSADGVFRFDSVSAGYFQLEISSLPPDAYVKEVRMGQQDLLGVPFKVEDSTVLPVDVTIGLDGATVDGVVVNSRQSPIANATVVLVPDAPLRDRSGAYRTGSTDTQGRFSIRAVPPGRYTAVAWDVVEPGSWYDPELLSGRAGTGTPVRLDSGTRANVRIQASGWSQ